jgi:hypothetical protein
MPKAKPMSPTEKLNRGQALNATDIQELLKDPNSWLAKLYNECLLAAAIKMSVFIKAIIQCIETLKLERAQRLAGDREDAARDRSTITIEPVKTSTKPLEGIQATDPTAAHRLYLNIELAGLLLTPQVNMPQAQLAIHHQMLVANYHQQMIAQLGPRPQFVFKNGAQALPLNFVAPPLIKPPVTPVQILQYNQKLNTDLKTDDQLRKGFAQHHARATIGYVSILKMVQEYLAVEENQAMLKNAGFDIDSANSVVRPILKKIDAAAKNCLDITVLQALQDAIQENMELTLKNKLGPAAAATQDAAALLKPRSEAAITKSSRSPSMYSATKQKAAPVEPTVEKMHEPSKPGQK